MPSKIETPRSAPGRKNDPNWVWIDVETTGLWPDKDLLLEAGLIITTPELEQLYEGDWLIPPDDLVAAFDLADTHVQKMHEENGLWDALAECGGNPTLAQVEQAIVAAITRNGATNGFLCGFNPAFDRKFLTRYLPKAASLLHYRSVDMNAFRITGRAWDVAMWSQPKDQNAAYTHRAFADTKDALDFARRVKVGLSGTAW
jgi:oligoribonuclease